MNPLAALEKWIEAWRSGDVRAVAARYAEDAVYNHAMVPEPITGREAILEFISGMGSAFSEIDIIVSHAVVSADEVAAELLHRGRHTGELPTPAGPIPASNVMTDFPAAHFFRVNDAGLIAEERMYANPMVMMAQLGVTPS